MRENDLELIAALVEGRLEDETEARVLIESAPEFREEYEAQKTAYEALREAGPSALSETERAALRRDVWTALRSEPGSGPARSPWYYRWSPVAAGLLVAVGLVAVLSQGGGDDSGEPMNLAAETTGEMSTSTAADSAVEESDDAVTSGERAQTETTSASEAMDGAGADSAAPSPALAEEASKVRQGDFSGTALQPYDRDEAGSEEVDVCFDQLGIDDFRIVATLPDPTTFDSDGDQATLLVAVSETTETDTAAVAFVDVATCELVYLDE